MGYVMNEDETGDVDLHVEIRRESIVFSDDYYPWREDQAKWGDQHVYVYGGEMRNFGGVQANNSASFEVSREWLAKMLKFFDNPDNREKCGVGP